tara:strand:- start:22489 stop:22836 length:348 start_codon:yes stop_codon:yes gene_type:complete
MATSRFNNKRVFQNRHPDYLFSDFFRRRNLKAPVQYGTFRMRHPTPEESLELNIVKKVWGTGDKYFNLAHKHYGDVQYWWVIAWWNRRPLETSFIPGDIVEIPSPLNKILEFYDI